QEWFLGAQLPVVDDVDRGAVLLERPYAAPVEVAARDDREAVRVARLDHLEFPRDGVRQPAFRQQPHTPAEAALIWCPQLVDGQVDRRPPSRQPERIADDVGHLAARAVDAPPGDEVILVLYQLLWRGDRLPVEIDERDVLEPGELVLHLRVIAHDRD